MTGRGSEVGGMHPSGGLNLTVWGALAPRGNHFLAFVVQIFTKIYFVPILMRQASVYFSAFIFFVGEGVVIKTRSFHYAHT